MNGGDSHDSESLKAPLVEKVMQQVVASGEVAQSPLHLLEPFSPEPCLVPFTLTELIDTIVYLSGCPQNCSENFNPLDVGIKLNDWLMENSGP